MNKNQIIVHCDRPLLPLPPYLYRLFMSCCEIVCERGWKRVPVCACVCVWVVCLRERMIPSKILATNLSKQQCIKLVLKTIYLLAKQTKRQEHQQRDRQTESSISFKAKHPQYWIIKWRKSDWSEAGIFFGGETNYSLVSPIQKLSVEIPSQNRSHVALNERH